MIDVKKLCRDKGLRMTEQRNIIADVITEMSANGHPDVNAVSYTHLTLPTSG